MGLSITPADYGGYYVVMTMTGPDGQSDERRSRRFIFRSDAEAYANKLRKMIKGVKTKRRK
jgi:hypothetical protein